MMEAAREALSGFQHPPLLTAVTVLTSLAAEELQEVGLSESPDALVRRLALLAQGSGLDGVVCSAREAADLRRVCGEGFLLVTPGIRPEGADEADQRRIMTPAAALAAGADHLVIGRPITDAADPLGALRDIRRALGEAGVD